MPEEKSEKEAEKRDSRRASVTRSAPRSARSGSYGPQKVADNADRGQEGVRNTVRNALRAVRKLRTSGP